MTKNHKIEIDKWSEFILQNIRGKKTQEALISYIKKLIIKGAPVILDFNHLSELLGLHKQILANIVYSSDSFYYSFDIPKRNGKTRKVSAPFPALLNAQKWIYENILINQPLHPNSKGFRKNISIKHNAEAHLNQRCILKMDLENFFPSIKINRVISIFRNLGYTKKISYYLSAICCYQGVLPQGGATSPCLSNIIAKRLDYRLTGLTNKFGFKYTRYADDLTFSGEAIPVRFITYVENIVRDEGFIVNSTKTKLIVGNKQKIITGISISSGRMTIPKKVKREIRKNVHYILSRGLFNHQKHIDSRDPIYLERLIGYLHFWRSIEPKNNYVLSSIDKLIKHALQLEENFKS